MRNTCKSDYVLTVYRTLFDKDFFPVKKIKICEVCYGTVKNVALCLNLNNIALKNKFKEIY